MALIDNLVAYWSLEEASGNAIDAHAANDLTETGGTIASAAGKVGNARDFEAADTEWFTIADNADLSLSADQAFTLQAWINMETNGASQIIIAKDDQGSNREYGMYVNGINQATFYVFDSGSNFIQVNTGSLSTGTWYLLHGWHDPTANQIGVAVNAGAAATTSHSAGTRDQGAAFTLGSFGGGGTYFDGLIDEAAIWKRVLTADERTELYNSGNGRDYSYISGGAPATTPKNVFGKMLSGPFAGAI